MCVNLCVSVVLWQGLVYILMGDKEKADASFVEFQARCPKDFPLLSTVDDILLESKSATRRMEVSGWEESASMALLYWPVFCGVSRSMHHVARVILHVILYVAS